LGKRLEFAIIFAGTTPQCIIRDGPPVSEVLVMSWLYLFFAGLFEIGWAVGFKLGASPAKPGVLALTIVSLILSMVLLALAMKELPFGTAYAVWTGIGVAGTFIIGLSCFGDPVNPVRIASFVFLLLGLIGLKLSS